VLLLFFGPFVSGAPRTQQHFQTSAFPLLPALPLLRHLSVVLFWRSFSWGLLSPSFLTSLLLRAIREVAAAVNTFAKEKTSQLTLPEGQKEFVVVGVVVVIVR